MYMVEINLDKTNDYIPFYTLWAAKIKAQEWAQCHDVTSLSIYDNETGELFVLYDNHELTYSASIS